MARWGREAARPCLQSAGPMAFRPHKPHRPQVPHAASQLWHRRQVDSYLRLWLPWLSAGRSQATSRAQARPWGRLSSSQRSLECLKEKGKGQVQAPSGSAEEDAALATSKAGLCMSGSTVDRAGLPVLCYLSTLAAPGLFTLQE